MISYRPGGTIGTILELAIVADRNFSKYIAAIMTDKKAVIDPSHRLFNNYTAIKGWMGTNYIGY